MKYWSYTALFIYIILLLQCSTGLAQSTHQSEFSTNTRYSFYSTEVAGELLLHAPSTYIGASISVTVEANDTTIGSWKGTTREMIRIPIRVNLQPNTYPMTTTIAVRGRQLRSSSSLIILPYKSNEVKIDRYTGGLIVNKRPWFPFGFYCYSPVQPTILEEVVHGFNFVSPYQQALPATLSERKRYMDRCADLGMKVHYNLLSVSGGGGVGSQIVDVSADSISHLLINEIETFKDHPALLAWYISDEPFPTRIAPDSLTAIYSLIKRLDPWHPVSIVFMAPFTSTAKRYSEALDIVMADPYAVPDMQPSYTGTVAKSLITTFRWKNPVWMATQSFGGGEIWRREPTANEIRTMTYSAIINGATGIQYFIRHQPNAYPKSTVAWAECGAMAIEIQELTPWLLSDENTINVTSSSTNISTLSKLHDGKLMIMVVNKVNRPQQARFTIQRNVTGRVKVPFENRSISMANGSFTDYLSAYRSQVYMIDIGRVADTLKPFRGNLILDPGFEDNTIPGVPTSCYAWNNGDMGATFFTDTREHVEGDHSLRLITPTDKQGVRLRFYPFDIKQGKSYYISVWAKNDPEQTSDRRQYFELSLGNFGSRRFILTDEWTRYITRIEIPHGLEVPKKSTVTLQMPSRGVAWFDMIQVFEGVDLPKKHEINPAYSIR